MALKLFKQVFVSTELREIISENLDELSPLLRTVFVLRDVQGYSDIPPVKLPRSSELQRIH
jgi:DNA-directed RNA polymerase specialized sigma24 family protein